MFGESQSNANRFRTLIIEKFTHHVLRFKTKIIYAFLLIRSQYPLK